eukprot:4589899-Prymnesium_polylepis.1
MRTSVKYLARPKKRPTVPHCTSQIHGSGVGVSITVSVVRPCPSNSRLKNWLIATASAQYGLTQNRRHSAPDAPGSPSAYAASASPKPTPTPRPRTQRLAMTAFGTGIAACSAVTNAMHAKAASWSVTHSSGKGVDCGKKPPKVKTSVAQRTGTTMILAYRIDHAIDEAIGLSPIALRPSTCSRSALMDVSAPVSDERPISVYRTTRKRPVCLLLSHSALKAGSGSRATDMSSPPSASISSRAPAWYVSARPRSSAHTSRSTPDVAYSVVELRTRPRPSANCARVRCGPGVWDAIKAVSHTWR